MCMVMASHEDGGREPCLDVRPCGVGDHRRAARHVPHPGEVLPELTLWRTDGRSASRSPFAAVCLLFRGWRAAARFVCGERGRKARWQKNTVWGACVLDKHLLGEYTIGIAIVSY